MKTRKKTKYWSNFIFFLQKLPFLNILFIKKLAHSLFGAWLFLLVHIRFTPSEGLKGFVN